MRSFTCCGKIDFYIRCARVVALGSLRSRTHVCKKTAPREGVRGAVLVVELVEGTTKSQGRKGKESKDCYSTPIGN